MQLVGQRGPLTGMVCFSFLKILSPACARPFLEILDTVEYFIFFKPLQRHIFTQILKNEGFGALYLGLTPALTRSVLYGGLRLGLYEPSKYVCEKAFGSTNILLKFVAGGVAGSFATALTNPAEVLKVL